jgi:hypothetical protein
MIHPSKLFLEPTLKKWLTLKLQKIVKEKRSASDGFDDTGVVCDGASDDVEEGERVEVLFWCALLGRVKYCLYEYFVHFVNFTCRADAS